MKNMFKKIKAKGFTLIEVSMAIALVAIGLTVGVLGYNGYQSWAQTNADADNASKLVAAAAQYKALGGSGALTGDIYEAAAIDMTVAAANDIYSVIATGAGLPSGVSIVPAGFQLGANAGLPSGWQITGDGVFDPVPGS